MFLKEYKGEHAPHFGTSKETCSLTVSRLQLHQRYVSDKLTCQPHVALRLQNVVLQFASEIHSADIILTALLWTERINLSKRIVSSTTGTTGPAQIHAPQSPLAVTSHRRNYAWACAEVITDVLLSSCGSRCTSSYFVQSAKSQAQITVVTDLQTEPQKYL